MKAFAIINNPNGVPALNDAGGNPLLYRGYVYHYQIVANWGTYLISGTPAQLAAIAALATVIPICTVTEPTQDGNPRWPELDDVLSSARRTRLNNWLSARGLPTVPATWTYRRVLEVTYRRIKPGFNLMAEDVKDGEVSAPHPACLAALADYCPCRWSLPTGYTIRTR